MPTDRNDNEAVMSRYGEAVPSIDPQQQAKNIADMTRQNQLAEMTRFGGQNSPLGAAQAYDNSGKDAADRQLLRSQLSQTIGLGGFPVMPRGNF